MPECIDRSGRTYFITSPPWQKKTALGGKKGHSNTAVNFVLADDLATARTFTGSVTTKFELQRLCSPNRHKFVSCTTKGPYKVTMASWNLARSFGPFRTPSANSQEWHPWWRYQMETFSAFLALCAGNSRVTGEFPSQRPDTPSFDDLLDLRLNIRMSKQS